MINNLAINWVKVRDIISSLVALEVVVEVADLSSCYHLKAVRPLKETALNKVKMTKNCRITSSKWMVKHNPLIQKNLKKQRSKKAPKVHLILPYLNLLFTINSHLKRRTFKLSQMFLKN